MGVRLPNICCLQMEAICCKRIVILILALAALNLHPHRAVPTPARANPDIRADGMEAVAWSPIPGLKEMPQVKR